MNDVLAKIRDLLFRRQKAYQSVFNSPVGREVLLDLARFCRAHESTFNADPRIAANFDGRREVWLRIEQHLQMDSEALWSLYNERMKQ
jgi:hypothetical protein